MKIAHFVNPWLPITQNWIYNQILHNKQCKHIILCRTLSNVEQFPIDNLYPAYSVNSFLSFVSMSIARLQARYPSGFYRSVIIKEKPDILHGHFAWESWRNIQLIKSGLNYCDHCFMCWLKQILCHRVFILSIANKKT